MLDTRYEHYNVFDDNIPFRLYTDLKRSPNCRSLQSNWHENLEIELCRDGEGYVLLGGSKNNIEKNDFIVINSNIVHYTGSESNLNYTCLIIDSKFCKNADIDHTQLVFETHFKSEKMLELFNQIIECFNDESSPCRSAKLQMTVLRILIELRQNHTVSEVPLPKTHNSFEAVKQTMIYIRENYAQKLTLETLSKNVYLDKYSLSRGFKKLTGQTVVEFLNNFRCEKAIELISNGTPVNEAARICGFNNMSFFTKTFKKYIGKLPSEYKSSQKTFKI